jgi:short-subunit dehydrogenase
MEEYILLTGASSGIGYEMATQLAAKKLNLILVARNETKLQEMQSTLIAKHGILVRYIVKDLSNVQAAINLYKDVQQEKLLVTGLINNAGVGNYGNFIETSLEEELKMIELNISSVVALTKLFAKDMVSRKSGKIMNVGSVLSFLPFPYYSVYSATKTFVLAFSETLAAELEGTGVTVTSLYPGTTDTGFTTDKMQTTNLYKSGKPMHPQVVATEGVNSKLPSFVPDGLMMKIKKHLASIKS